MQYLTKSNSINDYNNGFAVLSKYVYSYELPCGTNTYMLYSYKMHAHMKQFLHTKIHIIVL
jgi:hypothetical protein